MPKKKPAARRSGPKRVINGPAHLAHSRAICRGEPVPGTRLMQPKRVTAAERANEEAAANLAAITDALEARFSSRDPAVALREIDDLRARVAATTAWTQLAYDRLASALDKTSTGKRPTLGGVLTLIETLVADYTVLGRAERAIRNIEERVAVLDAALGALKAEDTAADKLIAHLAFNLAEGDEQEQIEAASPAVQRAFLAERAAKLIQLSLEREMAQRLADDHVATRTLHAQQCATLLADQPSAAAGTMLYAFVESRDLIDSPPGILDDVQAVEEEVEQLEGTMAATAEIDELAAGADNVPS